MRNNFFRLSFINLKRNKINIIFALLIFILNTLVITGLSFYKDIVDMWNDNIRKSYDFNLVNVSGYEDINSLAIKTKKNSHVRDVFFSNEFMSYAVLEEAKKYDFSGDISLIGTIPGTKKILYGNDLNNEYDIICPSVFFPDANAYSGKYDYDKVFDLKKMINKSIALKYVGLEDVKFNLVGVFDSTYDYSLVDTCYISHDDMKKLNNKYQPNFTNKNSLFVLLDDISNVDEVFQDYKNLEITFVKTIDTEVGDKILFITSILILIFMIIVTIFIYFLSSRRIINEYKNIAIYKIIGYTNKNIKCIFYYENLILILASIMLSLISSYFLLNNFIFIFLKNDPYLSLINMRLSPYIIILSVICTFFLVFISTKNSFKKINDFNIMEYIYD